jgi:iron complex outermembrane receptor protein
MKRMVRTLLCGLFIGIIGIDGGTLDGQIVETVEVEGRIVSDEPKSKNLMVISARDLKSMGVRDFGDLFSMFTSLNVSRRGALDTSFDIGMRGSNFQQVLIMVNGVPFGNPQTGHFNGDLPFSIQDIGKIEIIRGGSSTRYGAGAFAGVVNIILKKESGFRFRTSAGDNKFFSAGLEAGKRFGDLSFRLSLDRSRTSGFHPGREMAQTKLSSGVFFENDTTRLDLQAGYLDKEFGAQGFYAPYPSVEEVDSYFYQLGWRQAIGAFAFDLSYSYKKHNDFFILDRNNPNFFQNETGTFIRSLNLSTQYKGNKWTSSIGVEIRTEAMDSLTMGQHSRTFGALFMNINLQLFRGGGFDMGLRRTFIGDGHSDTTLYSGLFFKINRYTTARASYGTSFRLPSYTELYYNSPANTGNPHLKPEKSFNTEGSITYAKGGYILDITLFHRRQRDLVDWIKITATSPWTAINHRPNSIYGVELTQQFFFRRTSVTMGLEKLFTQHAELNAVSKYGLRFPDFSARLNIRHSVGKYLKLVGNYQFKQIHDTTEKGHFLDIILSVPLGKFEISARLDNVLGTIIEEIPGVPIPGRWIYLSIQYQ